MKLGAERKKVMFLAALVLLAAYFIYSNVFSSQPAPSAPTAAADRHTPRSFARAGPSRPAS